MLNQTDLNLFKQNGYLVIKPEKILSNKIILELKDTCNNIFPKSTDRNTLFTQNSFIFNNASYFKNTSKNNANKLFGFRATAQGWNVSKGLAKYIENNKLLSCAKQILDTNTLSLHTSALIKVYPGCDGEPNKLHVDTSGFVDDTLNFAKNNNFVLNTLIYLNDVTKGLAPMRVCPKSHLDFIKINEYFNKLNNTKKFTNNMHAAGIGIDENIVKELGYKIKNIYGKAGTIIFMSGNLLHSATKNETKKSRIHFNFNFSRRDVKEIRKLNFKGLVRDQKDYKNFSNQFNDKKIINRSYNNTLANNLLNFFYKYKFKIKNRLINTL
ncbi:MAG: hypothetical protein CMN44_00230 [SAR116 cluster bacterium]|nr:hypothetical protein [SAR116 cluster bacterium]RPH12294.1 MAG: hypothetical protein CBC14_000225 [Alphaproteobacteria bacterium TMED54]